MKEKAMNIFQKMIEGLQRIWDATARIFSPSDDDYPESGTQPYEGEPYEQK